MHDLLRRAGIQWLSGRAASAIPGRHAHERNVWLDDVDVGELPEVAAESVQEHMIVERKENQPVDWAAFNSKPKNEGPCVP